MLAFSPNFFDRNFASISNFPHATPFKVSLIHSYPPRVTLAAYRTLPIRTIRTTSETRGCQSEAISVLPSPPTPRWSDRALSEFVTKQFERSTTLSFGAVCCDVREPLSVSASMKLNNLMNAEGVVMQHELWARQIPVLVKSAKVFLKTHARSCRRK